MAKGDELQIGITIDEAKAIPELTEVLRESLEVAVDFVIANFKNMIILPLIYGGRGWKSLISTPSWRWINSPKGYGQLGFSSGLEPLKLLNAIATSWTVRKVSHYNPASGSLYIGLNFSWADIEDLRRATIHPYAGKLNLPAGRSWFDWIYSGVALVEAGYHFKKTGPRKGSRSSLIAGADAGLMKPGGLWQVTPRFRLDLDALLDRNEDKITSTIQFYLQSVLADETR